MGICPEREGIVEQFHDKCTPGRRIIIQLIVAYKKIVLHLSVVNNVFYTGFFFRCKCFSLVFGWDELLKV